MLSGLFQRQHVAERSSRAFTQHRPCVRFHCLCAKASNKADSPTTLWVPLVTKKYQPRTSANLRTPLGNLCPPVVHATLDPHPSLQGRLVVIGDVHGCVIELAQLLKKVNFNRAQDKLVFVGDLVNKGPRSQQAVQLAMALNAIVVRGNHDDAALWSYRNLKRRSSLMKETVSKYQWVLSLTPQEAAFMARMPFTVTVPRLNVVIAHAGLVPGIPVAQQRLQDVYRMRVLHHMPQPAEPRASASIQLDPQAGLQPPSYKEQTVLQDDSDMSGSAEILNPDDDDDGDDNLIDANEEDNGSAEPRKEKARWASKWTGPGHVIFGHDARMGLQQYDYATGIDTGCVYGKELTACLIPLQQASQQYGQDQTPTLEELHASLVSVSAREKYT